MTTEFQRVSRFTSLAALLIALSMALPMTAAAQGWSIYGQAVNSTGRPAAFATVRVCPYTGGGLPCNPRSSTYSNLALTAPVPNPYTTDQFGNYSFFVAANATYIVQVSVGASSGGTFSYLITSSSGTVSGQASGVVPLATGSTVIGAQSHITDNGATVGIGLPVAINASGASQEEFDYSGTPIVPSTGHFVIGSDSSGNGVVSENGGSISRLCTAANGQCPAGTVTGGSLTNFHMTYGTGGVGIAADAGATTDGAGNLSAKSLNGVVEVELQTGSDFGAQINAAVAAYPAGATLRAKAGTYAQSTAATLDPRLYSLVGDGPDLTVINCTVSASVNCLTLTEPTWSTRASQSLKGFTLSGNSNANVNGIYVVGGATGVEFDNITVGNFTGTGSSGIYQYNNISSGVQGWSEQTHFYKVLLLNNTVGLKLSCNTADTQTCSFGYTYADIHFGVNTGQVGLQMNSGRLYNSYLALRFNTNGSQTAGIQLNSSAYGALWDTNTYDITGEGTGVLISTATGTKLTGTGNIQAPGFTVSLGESSPAWGTLYSTALGNPNGNGLLATPDYGMVTNYDGSGQTATASPVFQVNTWGTIGVMAGAGIASPYVTMYGGAPNSFDIYECPFSVTQMTDCTRVSKTDNGGNLTLAGFVNFGGGVNISSSNVVPQVGTPTVGQAACIKAAGPPVVIGYCSTVVGAGGACTCN